MEPGEKLEAAVAREILEETGLQVRPREVVEIFERIMEDEQGRIEYHYVIVDYRCEVEGGTLMVASDVAAARWVRREEFAQYELSPGTLGVIEKGYRIRE